MEKFKSPHEETMDIFKLGIPIFQALADEIRQGIILLLAEQGEMNVGDITNKLPLSRPAISHHLKILKNSGLISAEKRGTENYYYLTLKESVELLKGLLHSIEKNCVIR